jgi:uncharacterized protein (TIGR02996 family)
MLVSIPTNRQRDFVMSPDNPLLKALLAQPDDDTLRLAVADWLEEHDQPVRAEIIRVQVELARGVEDRVRRNILELRQRDLLVAHEREWTKPIADVLDCKPGEWRACVFRRGFVEYFHLPAAVIIRRGERLARLTPVRELFLRVCVCEDILALAKCPWLRLLTSLYLPDTILIESVVQAVIKSPYLENLCILDAVAEDVSDMTAEQFYKRFRRHLVRRPHNGR